MTEDRCTGHCCRGFGLPDYATLQKDYDEALRRQAEEGVLEIMDRDILAIFPMLIYLGNDKPNPAGPVRGYCGPQLTPGPFYTCKNLLPSGDCGIYETRPHMCHHYPNGRPCEFVHCGSVINKNLNASSHVASQGAGFVPVENITNRPKPSLLRPWLNVLLSTEDVSTTVAVLFEPLPPRDPAMPTLRVTELAKVYWYIAHRMKGALLVGADGDGVSGDIETHFPTAREARQRLQRVRVRMAQSGYDPKDYVLRKVTRKKKEEGCMVPA